MAENININVILHQIQAELKAPKGQFNKFGGYKYRSCEDILEAVKPLLNETGATLTISDDIMLIGSRFYVKATAVLRLADQTVQTVAFAREEEMKKGMDGAQITGSASSYARKYALNGLFCIDDTKDADATNDHKDDKPVKTSKQEQKEQPQKTLAERYEDWIKFLSAKPDKSLKVADDKTATIINRVQDVLTELQTAGFADKYNQLNILVNSKLKKEIVEDI